MFEDRYISYLRVSTKRQGVSGLGLEAQRHAVSHIATDLLEEFVEVESGKNANNRPELAKALHQCKVTGAVLIIAKLDRLSRNAHFLLGLQEAGVRFVAADMPEANHMMVGFMALMAQYERELISKRTKEALAAVKRRGVKLGNPNGAACLRGLSNAPAVAAVKEKAQQRAEDLRPTIEALMLIGIDRPEKMAKEMNERGILTPRRKRWHVTTVRRLINRLGVKV